MFEMQEIKAIFALAFEKSRVFRIPFSIENPSIYLLKT